MDNIFMDILKKQYNFDKYSNKEYKSKAQLYYIAEVQNVYIEKRIGLIEKLKNKLDYIYCNILYSNIFTNLHQ